jgi:hypothetical protein
MPGVLLNTRGQRLFLEMLDAAPIFLRKRRLALNGPCPSSRIVFAFPSAFRRRVQSTLKPMRLRA